MSNNMNDGGQAFPSAALFDQTVIDFKGMSLRDYFAAAALQGLLGMMAKDYDVFFANKLAHACYETADAMLKARGGAK